MSKPIPHRNKCGRLRAFPQEPWTRSLASRWATTENARKPYPSADSGRMVDHMTTKEAVYQLVDALSEHELRMAKQLLERLQDDSVDPMLKALASAPYDDEPSTPDEDQSCKEAWAQRHESLSAEEAKRELLE